MDKISKGMASGKGSFGLAVLKPEGGHIDYETGAEAEGEPLIDDSWYVEMSCDQSEPPPPHGDDLKELFQLFIDMNGLDEDQIYELIKYMATLHIVPDYIQKRST